MSIRWLKIAAITFVFYIAFLPINDMITRLTGYIIIVATLMYAYSDLPLHALPVNTVFSFLILLQVLLLGALGINNIGKNGLVNYIRSGLSLSALLICLSKPIHNDNGVNYRFFFNCNKCVAIIFLIYTILPFNFRYTQVNQWGTKGFTLNMGNINATSILVMATIAILLIEINTIKKKIKRRLQISLICGLCYTLFLLGSRTVVFCTIFLIVVYVTYKRKKKISPWFSVIAFLMSIIAIPMQILLSNIKSYFIFGRPLASGRDELYNNAFQYIIANPVEYLFGRPDIHMFQNYHNAPLSLICNIGILGTLIYYIIWFKELHNCRLHLDNQIVQIMSYCTLLVFFIHSSSEAAPMLGVIPYATQMIILIWFARGNTNQHYAI